MYTCLPLVTILWEWVFRDGSSVPKPRPQISNEERLSM